MDAYHDEYQLTTPDPTHFSQVFDLFTQDEKYKRARCSAYVTTKNCTTTPLFRPPLLQRKIVNREKKRGNSGVKSKPREKEACMHECIPCTYSHTRILFFILFFFLSLHFCF